VFRATKAGALYAILVFLFGLIFGTIRVLMVAPHLGETTAVILEAPLDTHCELVPLRLVRAQAQCEADCPGSIIDGLSRLSGADIG
jgi:hypothetical protein